MSWHGGPAGRRLLRGPARRPADGHDFWGAGPGDTSEWYTLPENLYRAYLFFGDPLFRDFGDIWLYHQALSEGLAAIRAGIEADRG